MLKVASISLKPKVPNTKKEKGVLGKWFIRNGATIDGIRFKPSITGRRGKFRVISRNFCLSPETFGHMTIPKDMSNVFHPRAVNA